jgi:hypothetical protein
VQERSRIEANEMNRWLRWLLVPMIALSGFVGAAYATGIEWFFLPAILVVLTYPLIFWMLALTSDTIAESLEQPAESAEQPLRAAA